MRVKQLEDIGFHWAATDETNEQSTTTRKKKSSKVSWEERFNELKKFKAKTGHCVVPQDYSENKSLGQWVHNVSTIVFNRFCLSDLSHTNNPVS